VLLAWKRPTLPKQAVLIVNAMSRKGEDLFEEAKRKLEERRRRADRRACGHDPEQMRPTSARRWPTAPDGHRRRRRRLAVQARSTTSSAPTRVFALLPLGTANSFARTLGIPLDLDGAIDVIANGASARIDLGAIDGDYFANAAAMGLSPMIAETVPHKLKRYLGRSAI
jgi:hypothetical protein